MPEITVAMPAYNAGKFIRQAIDSVLSQTSIDLELIVVDDASTDDTVDVVDQSEQRIRLFRNERRMGIGYCHNVALRESRSPYIAHVDADDLLLPGALRKMVDALGGQQTTGQAHCYFMTVDERGRTSREAFYASWDRLHSNRSKKLDYKKVMAGGKNVINHLRTYPKCVLEELGGFNESLQFGIDYEMGMRILDRYQIKLVPEFLYCRRLHSSNTTESLNFKLFKFWRQLYRIRTTLVREKKARFLAGSQFDLHRFVGELIRDAAYNFSIKRKRALTRTASFIRWRLCGRVSAALYRSATQRFADWSLGQRSGKTQVAEAGRIAYYLYAFPIPSETFIQREVDALKRAGLAVDVLAHESYGARHFDASARRLMEQTIYLKSSNAEAFSEYSRELFAAKPLQLLNTFLYLVFRRHTAHKSFADDWDLFQRVVYLAAMLKKYRVTHVHAPWASTDALVALLAARLLNIPYTVQARAYDLHRNTSQFGLQERLGHADFVVTNARFNASVIQSLLQRSDVSSRISVIYEGIELSRFQPACSQDEGPRIVRILTVARIVAPKGLEYLLEVCKILKDRGHKIQCDVVGGLVASDMNYYVRLKRLQRRLCLENEVRFRGTRPFDWVLERYKWADVFVLPAVIAEDGSGDVTPNAVIEAMAMKLPIVSTKSRGIPELIEDGVSGILTASRDSEALATAVERLIEDPALRRTLGENARKRVEERFDINKNMQELVGLFGGGQQC